MSWLAANKLQAGTTFCQYSDPNGMGNKLIFSGSGNTVDLYVLPSECIAYKCMASLFARVLSWKTHKISIKS